MTILWRSASRWRRPPYAERRRPAWHRPFVGSRPPVKRRRRTPRCPVEPAGPRQLSTGRLSDMMHGRWITRYRFPLSRAPPFACHPSSKACVGSPTTCGGAGTPGAGAVQPDRRTLVDALSQPDRGPVAADRLVGAARRPGLHGRVPRTSSPTSTATWPTVATTGSSAEYAAALDGPIAYFCAEYGFHESLGIYSGGLGVLAGDHIKSASDMALPFVGVGLLYRKGYFRQTIDADGHQEHAYPDYDLARLPDPARPGAGRRAADRSRSSCPAGRCTSPSGSSRSAASRSCCSTRTSRERRGRPADHPHPVRPRPRDAPPPGAGPRRRRRPGASGRSGSTPAVWHLNEGHSRVPARRADPRARRRRERRSTRPSSASARNSVFTIHTPVSAGNERFDADLVRRVAGPLLDGDGRPRHRRRADRARPRARPRASTATRASST